MKYKNIITFILWIIGLYLLGSLVATSFNIKDWSLSLRCIVAASMLILGLCYSNIKIDDSN